MPTIDDLSLKEASKKFKRSNYRPWNYMDELEKEEKLEANVKVDMVICNEDEAKITNNSDNCHNTIYKAIKIDQQNILIKNHSEKVNPPNFSVETMLDKIFCLTGHQKLIFLFVVERCVSRGLLNTGIVKIETLCEITSTSFKMVKLSIKRLILKNLINRNEGKKGRGGFHAFSISESARNAFLEYKRIIGNDTNDISKATNTNITHIHSNKNGSILDEMPEEWKNINIDFLKDIGFSENHLKQLYHKKLNIPLVIEESIKHFSFGLLNNPKVKQYQDPLNVLIGVLRKGQAWIESNYKSPQEIAQETLLEQKKAETERLIKLEKDSYETAFIHWQSGLSSEEIEIIVPIGNKLLNKSEAIIPKKVRLKMFFEKNIWPTKKKEYLIEYNN
jgi:hypothetical protein